MKATVQATLMIRRQFPNIDVSVRLRNNEYEEKLTQAGATVIMPENLEPSLKLASTVLASTGRPQQEINQIIDQFRKSFFSAQAEHSDDTTVVKALSS